MRPLLLFLACVPLAVGAAARADDPAASGAEAVGRAAATEGTVRAVLGQETRRVEAGEAVYRGDWIETEADGRARIVLHDETELVVGPGSRVHLDEFVYDPADGSGRVLVEMGEGLLRFTTGVLAPEGYEVKTPVASIGVRGTIFDVLVSAVDYATTVILRKGGPLVIRSLVEQAVVEAAGKAARAARSDAPPEGPRDPTDEEEAATEPLKRPFRADRERGGRPGVPDAVQRPNVTPKPRPDPPKAPQVPVNRGGPPRGPRY
jgi:hypothetical protein